MPQLVDTTLGTVAVAEEGPRDALPVLCIHGIPGSSRDFRYLGPLLAGRLRVLRLEMPGFGVAPPGMVDTLDGWARVPGTVADALGLERYLILAHSFGGGAAILGAHRDPERVRGAVLLASLAHRPHRAFGMPMRRYAQLATTVRIPVIRWPVVAFARHQYRSRGLGAPASWRELALHLGIIGSVDFAAIDATARSLQAPVLCAFCSDDRLVEASLSRELAGLLPHARAVELPTGGHHVQKHRAEEVAAAVLERFSAAVDGS